MRVHGAGPAGVELGDVPSGGAGGPGNTHAEEGDGVGVYCVLSGEVEILNGDMSETLTKVAAGNIACAYVCTLPPPDWRRCMHAAANGVRCHCS